jgi:hypothetical protein
MIKLIINKLEQDPYGQKWKLIKINTKRKNSSKKIFHFEKQKLANQN